jgi:hypothetical protein
VQVLQSLMANCGIPCEWEGFAADPSETLRNEDRKSGRPVRACTYGGGFANVGKVRTGGSKRANGMQRKWQMREKLVTNSA